MNPPQRPRVGSPESAQFALVMDSGLPPHARFPYNHGRGTVGSLVRADLLSAGEPLLITAFTSLERVVAFLARCYTAGRAGRPAPHSVRILLGHEPAEGTAERTRLRHHALSGEIAEYWLARGVSIHLCADVLAAIEMLESGRVAVRTSGDRPVHAKIYRGDSAITLGSSNYSMAGMRHHVEANCRFTLAEEPERFREAAELSEAIWRAGEDYLAELSGLLRQLLRSTSWAEALGRACAELLEGSWARRYLAPQPHEEAALWPSQEQGIAQALWVLENTGSVLIADATGSGKTRMGAHLIRALQDRNWRTGRVRRDLPVMICPPAVADIWQREGQECGQPIPTVSHGVLSHASSRRHEDAIRLLGRAQVLAVDETHNFLNRLTARTRRLHGNIADHVVLFSATPINRGLQDLAAVVDLLGADNFDDSVLRVVGQISRWRRGAMARMTGDDLEVVRRAIQRFIVRRTKRTLNRLVDEAPDRYVNALGQRCRYPRHDARSYSCGETRRDRELASAIREAAQSLRGLTHLRKPLRLPGHLRLEGWDDAKYLSMRLRSSAALSAYRVGACLRSSRAALLEHLHGTAAASALCDLAHFKSVDTGDVIGRLATMRGRPPASELACPLPVWLTDPTEYARACDEEVAIYERIAAMARELSTAREDAKAAHLAGLLRRHDLVLAFDSRLITLSDLQRRVRAATGGSVLLATGQSQSHRVHDALALGSREKGVIALCSDALAEGVNLQAASALVLLDMPSVIRVAEQRIGRVDRMDSPHAAIAVYWPDDSPEFAVRSDELFRERYHEVAGLIGSNLELPASLRGEDAGAGGGDPAGRAISWRQMAEGVEEVQLIREEWSGLEDAFAQVRSLVEGAAPLVPPHVYETMRRTEQRVQSSVSVVDAPQEWIFLAIEGGPEGAPRWIYFEETSRRPVTDLDLVSRKLRGHLEAGAGDRPLDVLATAAIERSLARLQEWEPQLLPRKKRRALDEMRRILGGYERKAVEEGDAERELLVAEILSLAQPRTAAGKGEGEHFSVNLDALAEWWLDVIRPEWHAYLSQRRRRGPALLRHIRASLEEEPLATRRLQTIREVPIRIRPLDQRVVAAIVGVASPRA